MQRVKLDQIFPVTRIEEETAGAITEPQFRRALFHRHENGLEERGVVTRVGRRLYVVRPRLEEMLAEGGIPTAQPRRRGEAPGAA